ERPRHELAQLAGLDQASQANALSVASADVVLTGRQSGSSSAIPELYRRLAIVRVPADVDALARAMAVEGRHLLPEQGVHPNLQRRLRAAGRRRAHVSERWLF